MLIELIDFIWVNDLYLVHLVQAFLHIWIHRLDHEWVALNLWRFYRQHRNAAEAGPVTLKDVIAQIRHASCRLLLLVLIGVNRCHLRRWLLKPSIKLTAAEFCELERAKLLILTFCDMIYLDFCLTLPLLFASRPDNTACGVLI